MITLQEKMAAASNRPAGFDYMRLILASAVILTHSFMVTGTSAQAVALWYSDYRAVFGLILPMFFALSGFLVAGSLERNKSLVSFLGLRAIRLVPALALEVTLSALILGPLLTTMQLHDYFISPLFSHYFLNIIGDIHYHLPGLFNKNPVGSKVNSQLWTIPFELLCYISLAFIAFLGIAARRNMLALLLITSQATIMAAVIFIHAPGGGYISRKYVDRMLFEWTFNLQVPRFIAQQSYIRNYMYYFFR
jgi:peptidoglycan/LPS O-acetylase OafA/YrhL